MQNPMSAFLLIAAGFAGLTAVAAGAFGAHALRASLPPEYLAIYQTGALYHLVHAAALFGTALLSRSEALTGIATAGGDRLPVRASLGVATLGPDVKDAAALVALADEALYDAKGKGRGRVA